MRVTVPNPFGPPITIDSDNFRLNDIRQRYTPLSSFPQLTSHRRPLRFLTLLLGLVFLFTLHLSPPLPPSYKEEWSWQRVEGEGRDGRYVKFDVPKGTGFNHQLQRVLLHHHMAVLGNRSLAYEPFVQDETWLPFQVAHWPWRTAQIPLSAFVGSLVSGFERFSRGPRAVPDRYFKGVCPGYRQRVYTLKSEANPSGELELQTNGQGRIHQLQVMLAGSDANCIRIDGSVFDDRFFDSSAPLELYDSFIQSPVMKYFTFSPSVLGIVNRVMPVIAPGYDLYDTTDALAAHETPHQQGIFKHLLAIHLRRGHGWVEACDDKARSSAPFVAFNKLPLLPGNENVPPPDDMVEATRLGLYRAKCNPQVLEIIARARRMRKNHPLLKSVYILTDADDAFTEEMAMWLSSEGWDNVWVGKRDVYPDWDDRELGVAVDMEIARRAGVFVGNGFSTTSSNIVLLRSRDKVHPDLTQFW